MLLAERFREIGLTAETARETPPRYAALRDDPAALALRFFRDHATLTPEECRCVFGDTCLPDGLVDLGRACYRLDLVEDLYLFSDWPNLRTDEVLPPGETTAILFRAAVALCESGARVLDLGCGSGTLALLLARKAESCVASDINAHAIRLARLNAAVNGIGNVEFRLGSLFGPVAGDRFDLVVSQPPYVPRLPDEFPNLFLHGGERGDELARAILGEIAGYLTPAGRGMLFSDWPLERGEDLMNRVHAPGLQTLLFASPLLTLGSYARSYGDGLEAHFERLRLVGVRQCLAICLPGHGTTLREVLPHEWREIDRIIRSAG